jgi:hypothetical protein
MTAVRPRNGPQPQRAMHTLTITSAFGGLLLGYDTA